MQIPEVPKNTRWVIIEVRDIDGTPTAFVQPDPLKLEAGFVGDIVWLVFTPEWRIGPGGVKFGTGTAFDGVPQPDPNRSRCWSTAASNNGAGRSHYNVDIQHELTQVSAQLAFDPVVENEAPPGSVSIAAKRRAASRRVVAS